MGYIESIEKQIQICDERIRKFNAKRMDYEIHVDKCDLVLLETSRAKAALLAIISENKSVTADEYEELYNDEEGGEGNEI